MMHRGIVLAIVALPLYFFTGNAQEAPRGWHLLDYSQDSFYGISLNKAYSFLKTKNRKPKPVVVAVLDSGIDTTHEDLKPVLWHNPKEIPGNGIDDDGNGYIDDVYGWNFLGGKDGRDVSKAPDERSRIYHRFKGAFTEKSFDSTSLTGIDKDHYRTWKRASDEMNKSDEDQSELMFLEITTRALKRHDQILRKEMGSTEFTIEEVEKFLPASRLAREAKLNYLTMMKMMKVDSDEKNTNLIADFERELAKTKASFEAKDTPPVDYRQIIVKDDYSNIADCFYGNNDVMGPMEDADHGTHVSGLIGAKRNNGIGVDGVADDVKIMMLRIVPDGDEYDKDVALGIRYAVDNGAKVINMSFGKYFSPEKRWVDSAVKYAEAHDVLIVHASGNERTNVDEKENFPNPWLQQWNSHATNFINVGASSDPKISGSMVAEFSNYGKQNVDVFAPGERIYSTVPGSQYRSLNGTSMAAPIVSGLAALIRSYYPELSAVQVKKIIEESTLKPDTSAPCYKPGAKENISAPFDGLSRTGGIINAYNAVMDADTVKAVMATKEPLKVNQPTKSNTNNSTSKTKQ